jgi:hypothetical protein
MWASFYFCALFLCAAVTAQYENFCEENNVPDDLLFTWPGDCEIYIWCRNGGTDIFQCVPEGTWYIEGPNNEIGKCQWPAEDAVCDDTPLRWPPGNGECPPGSDVVILPSEFCDTFYICV